MLAQDHAAQKTSSEYKRKKFLTFLCFKFNN